MGGQRRSPASVVRGLISLRWRQVELVAKHPALAAGSCRPDIYRAALAPLGVELPCEDAKIEAFFDDRIFDPADLVSWLGR